MKLLLKISIVFLMYTYAHTQKSELLGTQASIEKISINYNGKQKKALKIRVRSLFPVNRDFFFDQEMQIRNTLIITKPMAHITIISPESNLEWIEGTNYQLKVLSYGLFPLGGKHYIFLEEINREKYFLQTREKNNMAKVWDHKLIFESASPGLCYYEDEIILYAKWLTPIFARYLVTFYKMRHKNWMKLLSEG